MFDQSSYAQQINITFTKLLEEYAQAQEVLPVPEKKNITTCKSTKKDVESFLNAGCGCKNNCTMLFSALELLDARFKFASYTTREKNYYLLSQLQAIAKRGVVNHARTTDLRKRQTFEYCINIDRPVCKKTFLFYHNETEKRLKRIQTHFLTEGCQPLVHGNTGKKPPISYGEADFKAVVDFILNLADCHGMPDPGRDVRRGKGRLRILLPSIMNYTSIHELYTDSITATGSSVVGYDTFVKIWQSNLPYIAFNNPKTDLCLTCENFKKQLNKIASILDEDKDEQQKVVHQEAVLHLKHVQQERLYYQACIEIAHKCLESLEEQKFSCNKPNSKDIAMHYSWDFAQQLHYPFEDQQVGPIYFKTPRRAQLFGVCCEAMPCQVNYLIDEADFTEKNANTVISLLDHFFSHYSFGEKEVYLTADNCTGQNKNNALIQYLAYRVLSGLHTKINLSFMVVGHTKFAPDGFFGIVKRYYRRSKVYTYEQLANLIEASSQNGHNICQRYKDTSTQQPELVYRDWTSWLANYFKTIPGITSYHHFCLNGNSDLRVREKIDSEMKEIQILKKEFLGKQQIFSDLPSMILPEGLSADRQWYLYDQVRMHIPEIQDQDKTCPKPSVAKLKKQ